MWIGYANYIGNLQGETAESIVNNFQARVEADGGVFEAESCLIDRVTTLRNLGFLPTTSVCMIAHGVKANKLYSLIPTNGGADFTFTRAGIKKRKASTYIETVATGVPSLDYTGSTCPALSLEPARTNLLLQSEDLSNASWAKFNGTVTVNQIPGPDNLSTADRFLEEATNTVHYFEQVVTKGASATQYTYSVFLKGGLGRDWVRLTTYSGGNGYSTWFNLTTGVKGSSEIIGTGWTIQSYNIKSFGDGWYRCDVTVTTGTETSIRLAVAATTNDLVSSAYLGDITKGFYVTAFHLEAGSYATSYIATTTATVQRVADAVPALTGVSDLIGQAEGTLYFEGSSFTDGTNKIISIDDGTANNRIQLNFAAGNFITVAIVTGGVTQATITNASFITGTNYKIAVSVKENKAAMTINGVKIGEDLTVSVPACSQIKFSQFDGPNPFYGNMKAFAISKTAITDAQAITLTT